MADLLLWLLFDAVHTQADQKEAQVSSAMLSAILLMTGRPHTAICQQCGYTFERVKVVRPAEFERALDWVMRVNRNYIPMADRYAMGRIADRESSFIIGLGNHRSTALGLFQLLRATRHDFHAPFCQCPACQIRGALRYIHARYGSPANAWAFWLKHHWY